MSLSLEDIDRELANRQGMGNSAISEIDAELQKRGVQPSSFGDVAKEAVKTALTQGPIQSPLNLIDPQNTEKMNEVMGTPMRGIRGLGVSAVSGIQRGAEAVKPDFKPQGIGEHAADFAAGMADPRAMAFNPMAGEAFGLAKKVVAPTGKFLGEQAARALQVMTGVPAENVIKTANRPMDVLFSKLPKTSGKIFQQAKEVAGVTKAEERLTAGIGDPSGFKRVADTLFKKAEKYGDQSITPGEALAWKKAASQLARKADGSAEHFYTNDALRAQKIIESKAPEVAKTQADVALSKTRQQFMSLLPRNKGKTPAVLRSLAAGGLGTVNPALSALFSPMLAALPATVGTGVALKALNTLGSNPVTRQVLLGILSKLKENQQSK